MKSFPGRTTSIQTKHKHLHSKWIASFTKTQMGQVDVAYLSAISGTNRNKPGQSTVKNVGVQLRLFGLSRSTRASICCGLDRCWSTNQYRISIFWNTSKRVCIYSLIGERWEYQLHSLNRLGPNGKGFTIRKENGSPGLVPAFKRHKTGLEAIVHGRHIVII